MIAGAIKEDVLKQLRAHHEDVTCIKFVHGPKKILSASEDKTGGLWEWEKSDSPTLLLNHSDWVMSVVVSRDSERIFSVSRDGILSV